MNKIPYIKVRNCFQVKGRGTVYESFRDDNPGVDLTRLAGERVRLFDKEFRVIAVECSDRNGVLVDPVGLVLGEALSA